MGDVGDVGDGTAEREAALAIVDYHADEEWKIAAQVAVIQVAAVLPRFTTDDVWDVLDDTEFSTHERRAMGAIMRRVAKFRLIMPTDEWRLSVRPECHRRPLRVWRSM